MHTAPSAFRPTALRVLFTSGLGPRDRTQRLVATCTRQREAEVPLAGVLSVTSPLGNSGSVSLLVCSKPWIYRDYSQLYHSDLGFEGKKSSSRLVLVAPHL